MLHGFEAQRWGQDLQCVGFENQVKAADPIRRIEQISDLVSHRALRESAFRDANGGRRDVKCHNIESASSKLFGVVAQSAADLQCSPAATVDLAPIEPCDQVGVWLKIRPRHRR